MAEKPLLVVGTDRLDGDTVLVEYSDDTTGVYSVAQLKGIPQESGPDVPEPEE